jgi:hypothetical protein
MKNSTKVRLHLSKQLFESLTREIIKEAKANDGYTVAVKQPKMPKQSKAQAASPEVQKTDKEAMMGEMETNVAEKKDKVNEFVGTETADSGTITVIATLLGIGIPLATALVKDLMKAKTPQEKKQVIQKDLPAKEEKLNEISSEEVAAIVGLLPGVGLTAAYIKDVLSTMKEKGLKGREGWKKASQEVGSDAKAHMDRTVGGNTPGQGHGVDTSKTFGPQNEKKEELKEYEQHYRMVNGQCRRYNDEGEYDVVSSHYCH